MNLSLKLPLIERYIVRIHISLHIVVPSLSYWSCLLLPRSSSPSTVWAQTSPLRRGWRVSLWTCRSTPTATTTAATSPSTAPSARSKSSVTRERRGRSETRRGSSPAGKGRWPISTRAWPVSQWRATCCEFWSNTGLWVLLRVHSGIY